MNPRLGLLACAIAAGCFNPTGSTDPSNPTTLTGSTDDAGTTASTSDTGSGSGSTAITLSSSSTTGDPSATTSGGVCGDGLLDLESEECDDGNEAPDDGCSENCTKEFRRVFITSQVWTGGDLGGLEGADQKCQDAAATAGLPGVYKAWLSVATESPIERFVHSDVPYKQVNGVEIASGWSDLTDGEVEAGIVVSELNGPAGTGIHSCMPVEIPVWTGTAAPGSMIVGDYHCNDWTATLGQGFSGRAGSTDSQWTQSCITTCLDQAALYCVEQ